MNAPKKISVRFDNCFKSQFRLSSKEFVETKINVLTRSCADLHVPILSTESLHSCLGVAPRQLGKGGCGTTFLKLQKELVTKYADSQDVPDLPCGGEGDDAQGRSDGWARGQGPPLYRLGDNTTLLPPTFGVPRSENGSWSSLGERNHNKLPNSLKFIFSPRPSYHGLRPWTLAPPLFFMFATLIHHYRHYVCPHYHIR